MIRAFVVLGAGGKLLSFAAKGHALDGERGRDIVCAAFSVLARTAYRALEALPGIELRGAAVERGNMSFEVVKEADSVERASGIADCLVVGIGDLAQEHPDAVELVVEHDWRE
jgi:uncharacterized protein YsxB (DUF464 family)